MALAALIAAYHESAEPGALRATLPLAGRTLIERQARLARAAGAARIVVLAERMPPALSAALDRLRREGLPVQVARGALEAAEAVEPDDRLLLVADGAIADASQLSRLAQFDGGAAVLTVPDSRYGEIHERIDADTRWAGLAAVNGATLRDTAAMLRDWDLQSTLLRRTLQAGASSLEADGPVAIVDSLADVASAERRIVEGAREPGRGWAGWLLAPIERAITGLVMGTPISPGAIGTAAAVSAGLGTIAFSTNWLWPGLIFMLLATPLEGVALRLARLRMQRDARRSWWSYLVLLFSAGGLIGLSYVLAPLRGWGMVLLALVTLAFLIALHTELLSHKPRGAAFLAERRGMVWLMLPFALFGYWDVGVGALCAYAAGSFFWAQQAGHAARPKAGLD